MPEPIVVHIPIPPERLAQARRILKHVRDDLRGEQAAASVVDAAERGVSAPLVDVAIVGECAAEHGLDSEC